MIYVLDVTSNKLVVWQPYIAFRYMFADTPNIDSTSDMWTYPKAKPVSQPLIPMCVGKTHKEAMQQAGKVLCH